MAMNKDTLDFSDQKNSSFKIYSMKSNYISYLTKENLYFLIEIKGKAINNIPFVNSYLKTDICKLEEVKVEEEYIYYRLDFQKEKIIYDNKIPLRIIQHQRIEFIHYYKVDMGCIFENKSIDSMKVLSVGMVLAYWALINNYITKNIPYGKPVIETLSIDFNVSLGFFEGYLLRYIKYVRNDYGESIELMENWWEGEVKVKDYEAKLLRKNSIKYTINLPSGDKHNVIFSDNGHVKSTIPLSFGLIKKYIYMIRVVTINSGLVDTSFNILNILEEWITYISKSMYEEYKIKKKIAVIQDLKNIIVEALKNEEESLKESDDILILSLFAQQLFSICMQYTLESKEKISIDIIEYDSLCTFLKWYVKDKDSSNLRDADLQNILQSFYSYIRGNKGHVSGMHSYKCNSC